MHSDEERSHLVGVTGSKTTNGISPKQQRKGPEAQNRNQL